MLFPHNYPWAPPKVQIITTDAGRCRFNPNLYSNGNISTLPSSPYQSPSPFLSPSTSQHRIYLYSFPYIPIFCYLFKTIDYRLRWPSSSSSIIYTSNYIIINRQSMSIYFGYVDWPRMDANSNYAIHVVEYSIADEQQTLP